MTNEQAVEIVDDFLSECSDPCNLFYGTLSPERAEAITHLQHVTLGTQDFDARDSIAYQAAVQAQEENA